MPEAVIVSTARTPIGRAYKGSLADTNGSTLAAHVIRHAVARAGVALEEIDDVILGSAHPEGATGNNVARVAAIEAGCSFNVPGMTLDANALRASRPSPLRHSGSWREMRVFT